MSQELQIGIFCLVIAIIIFCAGEAYGEEIIVTDRNGQAVVIEVEDGDAWDSYEEQEREELGEVLGGDDGVLAILRKVLWG